MTALVARDGTAIRKGRISPALRTALILIVEEGLTIPEAAQRTGYKPVSLEVALRKPHVRAAKAAVKRAWLESQTDKAWLTMAKLSDRAASEDVQHKSAKVFLEVAGELAPKGDAAAVRPTVNIVINHPDTGHSIPHRLPGVIEAQPIQRARSKPSNSDVVGRMESDQ